MFQTRFTVQANLQTYKFILQVSRRQSLALPTADLQFSLLSENDARLIALPDSTR